MDEGDEEPFEKGLVVWIGGEGDLSSQRWFADGRGGTGVDCALNAEAALDSRFRGLGSTVAGVSIPGCEKSPQQF